MATNIPLGELFVRALNSASKASKLSMTDKTVQGLVVSSIQDLDILAQSIDISMMFSSNETLEDIPTRHLPYLLVEFVRAVMEDRFRSISRTERMQRLRHSQRYMHMFLDRLRRYEVIPDEERKLYSPKSPGFTDAAKVRDLKIKQFKQEKALRGTLETIRTRRGQHVTSTNSGDDLELISSLLSPSNTSDDEEADDDDEELRPVTLLILRLMWAHGKSQIQSMEQELELLENAPLAELEPTSPKEHEDATWRLDLPLPRGGPDGKGPLMDSSGKPLRPFTLLPGGDLSQRSRLQSEVFRPDHRLPTMTMDEYLEEEQRRGNIITGGGPKSQLAPTRSEQLMIDSEMDGTVEGEIRAEEKRQEDEDWARYTDLHPKGEGNTMNRG